MGLLGYCFQCDIDIPLVKQHEGVGLKESAEGVKVKAISVVQRKKSEPDRYAFWRLWGWRLSDS